MNKLGLWAALTALLAACGPSAGDKKKETEPAVSKPAQRAEADTTAAKVIVFFGNSLTAGYGVEPAEAYPGIIQKRLDSLGLGFRVVNAGVSGETTAGGNSRIDWILRSKPDVFVLELGGNDGLRGIPVGETKTNLQRLIDKVKKRYPETVVILAGMQVPPSMGKKYADEFKGVYSELARANGIDLIPFLLEGVGGERQLNQKDGIHPTPEGHRILAENVWNVLKNHVGVR